MMILPEAWIFKELLPRHLISRVSVPTAIRTWYVSFMNRRTEKYQRRFLFPRRYFAILFFARAMKIQENQRPSELLKGRVLQLGEDVVKNLQKMSEYSSVNKRNVSCMLVIDAK